MMKKALLEKFDKRMSIATLIALVAIIWEMTIYRKTLIHFIIPFSIFLVGGTTLFWLLKGRIRFYSEIERSLFVKLLHGVLVFGGVLMFIFMALNYYLVSDQVLTPQLKVEEKGQLAKGRNGCGNPYVLVNYKGFEKQLILPCGTDLRNVERVKLELQEGLFGFMIVRSEELVYQESKVEVDEGQSEKEEEQIYLKLIDQAEINANKGEIEKAIALYERALIFKPSDEHAKKRLKELKKKEL